MFLWYNQRVQFILIRDNSNSNSYQFLPIPTAIASQDLELELVRIGIGACYSLVEILSLNQQRIVLKNNYGIDREFEPKRRRCWQCL